MISADSDNVTRTPIVAANGGLVNGTHSNDHHGLVNGTHSNDHHGLVNGTHSNETGSDTPQSIVKPTFINSDGNKIPVNQPRKLKVIQIGAGVSGIQMCHTIQDFKDVEFVVYEKNSDLGGTWFENRYPGCKCDIPAHAYCFTWAPNPDWSSLIVGSPEILNYLVDVVDSHGYRRYMHFSHKVTGATWSESTAQWTVKIVRETSGDPVLFTDTCDLLLSGTGLLNNWKYPEVEGLKDYKGKLLHTATWDESYDFSGKTVAVLGTGASALQVVPMLQPIVKKIDPYVRSPTWLLPDPWLDLDPEGMKKVFTPTEKARFKSDPEYFLKYRKDTQSVLNRGWQVYYKNTPEQNAARDFTLKRYQAIFKDTKLREFMTPDFPIGCRRPTTGDSFVEAIQASNAEVLKFGATKLNAEGIIGADGVSRSYDAIVCATGFDTSFKPRFPIHGRRGHELQKEFEDFPSAYMSIAVHGFPNFFIFAGPISPVGNGSAFPGAEKAAAYFASVLRKMQTEGIRTIEVQKGPQDDFNEWVQERMKYMVWTGGCISWNVNKKTGKVQVTWPGSLMQYHEAMKDVHYEHYDIDYLTKNRFDWLGNGLTWDEMYDKENTDWAPYIT